ncbi:hypothetical protein M2G64_20875, partial [Vibrio vulnificus]|nr:hypothetical protein [Vibrio vulnificus]
VTDKSGWLFSPHWRNCLSPSRKTLAFTSQLTQRSPMLDAYSFYGRDDDLSRQGFFKLPGTKIASLRKEP